MKEKEEEKEEEEEEEGVGTCVQMSLVRGRREKHTRFAFCSALVSG